jgi:hypothetical protein
VWFVGSKTFPLANQADCQLGGAMVFSGNLLLGSLISAFGW